MSKAKQKSKISKEATAQREDETNFMEDSADTSLKTGHSRPPGATGGEGSTKTSEVSGPGEEDQVKKKPGTFKRLRKDFSKVSSHSSKSSSKHAVQSPTSPTSPGDDSLRQSEETEEVSEREIQELEQKPDITQQCVQGTDQVTKDIEVQMEQLKQQHKRALEEKDKQLAESRAQLQQRYDKNMMERMREFQTRFADAEQRHSSKLDDQKKQYDLSLAEMRKGQHDVLELQVAQVKRKHEKELQRKEEENTHKMEQEIQQREQVLRQEFQQREQVLQQELQQKDRVLRHELQQREQKLHQQGTQLRRYEQEVIEKNAKIAQLESDLLGMIPSSEPPSEENWTDLHSNVVELAREISHYVDPENVLPSVLCCHHLTPPEVEGIVEVLGGQEQLQERKPQNYCFVILPADNYMQSVLFDYTGTFRPRPDDQVCPLRAQEEDGFHTPPSTPTTEVPRMFPPDASASDVAANLPDSEKVKRLQNALDCHIQLHADMEEKVKSKTDEVEHWQNEIANLQREMEAKDEQLRAQGEEIQVLRQRVKEKEQEIEEKLQSIEDFHKKVEQRDRQLDILKKPPKEVELSPKALEEYDKYFDHVLKLTEELTDSEATVKKQQQELEKHRKLVERAERMEEQVTCGAVELSEKEQQIKELSKLAQKLPYAAVPKDIEELEDEVDRLRPFEQETKELKTQLQKVQDECRQKSELESKLNELEEDMRVKETEYEVAFHELEDLRERNGKLEMQLRQRERSLMRSQGASEEALQVKWEPFDLELVYQVKVLQEKLQARDEELEMLRQQITGSGVPLQASLKYEDLPPGTDPRVEIAVLKQALENKEQEVKSLQVRVRSFEDVIKHTKEQSRQVVKLKQELTALKSAELSKLRGEVGDLRKENDELKGEIEAQKAQAVLWKEDFQKERRDREQAARRLNDEQAKIHVQNKLVEEELRKCHTTIQQLESENKKLRDEISVYQGESRDYQQVMTNFDVTQRQLVEHKEQMADMEQLFQAQQQDFKTKLDEASLQLQEYRARLQQSNWLQRTQLEEVRQQLRKTNQYLDQAVTDNEKLQDDVLAKTQQVKQYKKQVDGLKAAVETQVTAKQEFEAEKTQQINNLRRQLQDSMERLHHQEAARVRADQQLRGEIQRLSNQLQLQSSGGASQSDELAPYHVPFFKAVAGEQKGSGSYGSVHLIEVNGIPCIAKQLHDILVGRNREEDVGIQQRDVIQRKFRNECILLSRLKHPNIVQFMGVHYDHHDPSNLTLIMEYLPMDLEKCLKLYANLPLSMIISILLDVSYGLLHLHSQTPSIIHRDLTAANILVTCDMKAKIADLGVSKILELNPLLASAQSALPGALAYMPPEALVEEPQYDVKLDVFSFGVVSLYAAIQEFPLVHENFSVAAFQNKELQILKRRVWIGKMGSKHCLHQLVIQCLKDDPAERPSTDNINATLKQLSNQHPKKFQNVLQMYSRIETLEQQLSELQAQTMPLQREREELLRKKTGQNVQQVPAMQQRANVQSPTAVNTLYYNYRAPTLQPADGQAQSQYGLRPSYPVPRPRHNRSPYPPQQ